MQSGIELAIFYSCVTPATQRKLRHSEPSLGNELQIKFL